MNSHPAARAANLVSWPKGGVRLPSYSDLKALSKASNARFASQWSSGLFQTGLAVFYFSNISELYIAAHF